MILNNRVLRAQFGPRGEKEKKRDRKKGSKRTG